MEICGSDDVIFYKIHSFHHEYMKTRDELNIVFTCDNCFLLPFKFITYMLPACSKIFFKKMLPFTSKTPNDSLRWVELKWAITLAVIA